MYGITKSCVYGSTRWTDYMLSDVGHVCEEQNLVEGLRTRRLQALAEHIL